MISIVIPLYNKEAHIRQTLQSVLEQTFREFEIIIVNDGSTDNSINEINKIEDERIRIIHQENQGVSPARNRGIKEARHEYIAFLDADDEWVPEYLDTMVKLIDEFPACSIFGAAYEIKGKNGKKINAIINNLPFEGDTGMIDNYFEVASCSHPPLFPSNVIVRTKAFEVANDFPSNVKSGEDLLTLAGLAIHFKIAYTTKILVTYHFDMDEFNSNPRKIDPNDIVGETMIGFLKSHPDIPYLKKYIGIWYRNRTSTLLRYASWTKVWKEGIKSLKYNPTDIRIPVYGVISLLPVKQRLKFFRFSSSSTS